MTYHAHDGDFTFAEQVAEWGHVPVEGMGYPKSSDLLLKSDDELRAIAASAAAIRYGEGDLGRNPQDRWRRFLHEPCRGKHVLDFGCGFGLESLELARLNCGISLADIAYSNVRLAERVLKAHGVSDERRSYSIRTTSEPPFGMEDWLQVDVFYCNGVLHHIPYPREILLRASEILAPEGKIVLMLYTGKAWEAATGSPVPPVDDDTSKNPLAPKFRATFDCVGRWADWYTPERLEHRFGDFLKLESWDELNLNGVYAAAVLTPRSAK